MRRRESLNLSSRAGVVAALGGLGTLLITQRSSAAASGAALGLYPFGLSDASREACCEVAKGRHRLQCDVSGSGEMNIYDHYAPALLAKYPDPSLEGLEPWDGQGSHQWKLALEGKSDLIRTCPNITRGLLRRGKKRQADQGHHR